MAETDVVLLSFRRKLARVEQDGHTRYTTPDLKVKKVFGTQLSVEKVQNIVLPPDWYFNEEFSNV